MTQRINQCLVGIEREGVIPLVGLFLPRDPTGTLSQPSRETVHCCRKLTS